MTIADPRCVIMCSMTARCHVLDPDLARHLSPGLRSRPPLASATAAAADESALSGDRLMLVVLVLVNPVEEGVLPALADPPRSRWRIPLSEDPFKMLPIPKAGPAAPLAVLEGEALAICPSVRLNVLRGLTIADCVAPDLEVLRPRPRVIPLLPTARALPARARAVDVEVSPAIDPLLLTLIALPARDLRALAASAEAAVLAEFGEVKPKEEAVELTVRALPDLLFLQSYSWSSAEGLKESLVVVRSCRRE